MTNRHFKVLLLHGPPAKQGAVEELEGGEFSPRFTGGVRGGRLSRPSSVPPAHFARRGEVGYLSALELCRGLV